MRKGSGSHKPFVPVPFLIAACGLTIMSTVRPDFGSLAAAITALCILFMVLEPATVFGMVGRVANKKCRCQAISPHRNPSFESNRISPPRRPSA